MNLAASTTAPSEAADMSRAPELAYLPPEFVRTLSAEQRALLYDALRRRARGRYPVDLRITLPRFGRGVFVTLIVGREKRSVERRAAERARYPLHRLGNVAFLAAVAALLYALVVTGAVLAGGIPLGAG